MRTLVHLSDLHFGRIDYAVLEPLLETVRIAAPDLVVVSGDLTQRARRAEFVEARAFLDRLPAKQLVVPGNHDIPLYDVFARLFRPLAAYRRHITPDLTPFHVDDAVAVIGIDTAHGLTSKHGRIQRAQIEAIRSRLCALPASVVKIVVTHHPFDVPTDAHHGDIVRRAEEAMEAFARCGVDVLLSGHLHTTDVLHSSARFRIEGHSALLVQAGTATSTRGRGEANSFNVIRIDGRAIEVDTMAWDTPTARFRLAEREAFEKTGGGWARRALA